MNRSRRAVTCRWFTAITATRTMTAAALHRPRRRWTWDIGREAAVRAGHGGREAGFSAKIRFCRLVDFRGEVIDRLIAAACEGSPARFRWSNQDRDSWCRPRNDDS